MTCKNCIYDRTCPHIHDTDADKCGAYTDKEDFAKVRHGYWKRAINQKHSAKWSRKVACSVCNHQGYDRYKYCPECGAKMDGKDDAE